MKFGDFTPSETIRIAYVQRVVMMTSSCWRTGLVSPVGSCSISDRFVSLTCNTVLLFIMSTTFFNFSTASAESRTFRLYEWASEELATYMPGSNWKYSTVFLTSVSNDSAVAKRPGLCVAIMMVFIFLFLQRKCCNYRNSVVKFVRVLNLVSIIWCFTNFRYIIWINLSQVGEHMF